MLRLSSSGVSVGFGNSSTTAGDGENDAHAKRSVPRPGRRSSARSDSARVSVQTTSFCHLSKPAPEAHRWNVKRQLKILNGFCAPSTSVAVARCMKLLIFHCILFYQRKSFVLVLYPLPTSEVLTQICWPFELSSHRYCWVAARFVPFLMNWHICGLYSPCDSSKFFPEFSLHTRAVGKFSDLTYVKLGTNDLWIGNRTGVGVTATLRVWWSFFGRSSWLHGHRSSIGQGEKFSA